MSSIISLDPSSPAFAASFPNFSTSSTSETSPSFSPLPGSLLVVLASWTGSYSVSPSISDTSGGGSYSHPVHFSSAIFGAASGVDIWTRYLSTAPSSSMNVKVSWSGSEGFETVFMRVLVLDNCNSSQSGVASNRSHSGLGARARRRSHLRRITVDRGLSRLRQLPATPGLRSPPYQILHHSTSITRPAVISSTETPTERTKPARAARPQ